MNRVVTGNGDAESLFIEEIEALHRYLEQWLKGKIPRDKRGPTRLGQALAEDFTVVHPSGVSEGKGDVIRNFASAYNTKPNDYSLDIREIAVEILPGDFCFATYRESHGGEVGRSRIACALLRSRVNPRDIEWLFLQETFSPD